MNEPSSFCDGSCGSNVDPATMVTTQALVPVVAPYPEGYDSAISGYSGNFTVNGVTTFNPAWNSQVTRRGVEVERRDLAAANGSSNGLNGGDPNNPPYVIHNGPSFYLFPFLIFSFGQTAYAETHRPKLRCSTLRLQRLRPHQP